jgi:hypothetical protein
MRSILGIVLLLLGIGLASCRIENGSAEVSKPPRAADWVRTSDGWERPGNWAPSLAPPPAVHPLVIAAGQLLVSMLALAAARPVSGSRAQ